VLVVEFGNLDDSQGILIAERTVIGNTRDAFNFTSIPPSLVSTIAPLVCKLVPSSVVNQLSIEHCLAELPNQTTMRGRIFGIVDGVVRPVTLFQDGAY
jgi:hypothetical protein